MEVEHPNSEYLTLLQKLQKLQFFANVQDLEELYQLHQQHQPLPHYQQFKPSPYNQPFIHSKLESLPFVDIEIIHQKLPLINCEELLEYEPPRKKIKTDLFIGI